MFVFFQLPKKRAFEWFYCIKKFWKSEIKMQLMFFLEKMDYGGSNRARRIQCSRIERNFRALISKFSSENTSTCLIAIKMQGGIAIMNIFPG